MKISLLSFALACLLLLSGCDKNKDAKPIEKPISAFLKDTVSIATGIRTSGPWELGISFTSSVAGKITQVGSNMPDPGAYRVLIWDFDARTLLRQKSIEQSAPATLVMGDVEPLEIVPNKKYVISINSRSGGVNKRYAFVRKKDNSDLTPFTKGSILVHNSMYSAVETPTFPNSLPSEEKEFYGFPEFSFKPD